MWGAELLPQPSILPLVDLVITHAREQHDDRVPPRGKPMVALPLFWDQVDNAQRIDETGVGVRLAPYSFEPDELLGAIDRLLADEPLRARLEAMAARIRAADGRTRAADLIASAARPAT